MSTPENPTMQQIAIHIERDLTARIDALAARRERPRVYIIRQACREYLNRYERKQAQNGNQTNPEE
mgnify:CR=1 FL=1